MADVRILQNKTDGSLWADLPGGQLQPVTKEQADILYGVKAGDIGAVKISIKAVGAFFLAPRRCLR